MGFVKSRKSLTTEHTESTEVFSSAQISTELIRAKIDFTLKSKNGHVPILHRLYHHPAGKQCDRTPIADTGLGIALHTRHLRINAGCWLCHRMVTDIRNGNLHHKHGGKDPVGKVGIFWHFLCGTGYVHFRHALQRTRRVANFHAHSPACNHHQRRFYIGVDQ